MSRALALISAAGTRLQCKLKMRSRLSAPGDSEKKMGKALAGPADVELLDRYLSALEAAYGIERGSTPVVVLVTETAEAMFHTGDYKDAARVVALFEANPGVGAIGWKGGMLDRAHLSRAQALLAHVEAG